MKTTMLQGDYVTAIASTDVFCNDVLRKNSRIGRFFYSITHLPNLVHLTVYLHFIVILTILDLCLLIFV